MTTDAFDPSPSSAYPTTTLRGKRQLATCTLKPRSYDLFDFTL